MASAASHSSHAMHARQSGANSFINGASLAPSNIASTFSDLSWTTTILVLVATLLVLEQSVYRYKKAHLPGAKWTIPVIGKFADSLAPTMEKYKKTWATPLAAVSVFNM
ncbi:hypothetical protein P389DRAFT_195370 [Cystobasidium minutum MCA 4210]|uniref:uncharacterized protein n=1 Tax=Cystobasidium minutum MCA 4210 TaxID=1397322 RepID=UPI0034CD090E|eukprot:jgi/Rhomi1/195370/gm1.3584_g